MKSYYLLVIAFTFSFKAQTQDYLPAPTPGQQILSYTQFTLSYNEEHEQASWVAYALTRQEVEADFGRCSSSCFDEDDRITTGSATVDDYRSTGFDRGHLCPAEDNDFSEQSQQESFLLSNISPQLPSFNQGIWAHLEVWVRVKAVESDTIYVVTGPVFSNNLGKIGANEVTIPGYYYKVLLKFEDGSPRTIGFLLPHVGAVGTFSNYQVPVNTIETLTGIDFFPFLDDSLENSVEAQTGKRVWGL